MKKLYYFWIPVLFIMVQFVLELSFSREVLAVMHSESGPHELLQFVLMTVAFVFALRILILKPWRVDPFLGVWVGIAALGCFYVAGEEVSWGQHILNWGTPDYWKALNDQGETNFHNTSSWLDQKPRLILEIGMLTGGLIIPLLLKFKSKIVPEKFSIIYPTMDFIPMVIVTIGINIADKVSEIFGVRIFERSSEVEEIYLFYFVLLYLILLLGRVKEKSVASL